MPRLVKYRLTSMESALELCRRGFCAVFLPAFLVDVHNAGRPVTTRLAEIRGPIALGPVTRRVHVVHRDGDSGDPDIDAVADATRALLGRAG